MYRIKNILREIKWFFQKVFRKNHISDPENWYCFHYLARLILPRLIAFRKQDISGYPDTSGDSSDIRTVTLKENDEDLNQWLKTIDEMIYAFEYILYSDSAEADKKKEKAFFIKYFGEDPYANRKYWAYQIHEAQRNGEEIDREEYFGNEKLLEEAEERAKRGLELFAKYFRCLWD